MFRRDVAERLLCLIGSWALLAQGFTNIDMAISTYQKYFCGCWIQYASFCK